MIQSFLVWTVVMLVTPWMLWQTWQPRSFPYFTVLIGAAVLSDATIQIMRSSLHSPLDLPLWAVDGGRGKPVMTILCITSQIITWSAVIGTFFVISPWYYALIFVFASYVMEAWGALVHLVPRNVMIRFIAGAGLLALTYLNFFFAWLHFDP